MSRFMATLIGLYRKLTAIPLVFLGIGLQRAWTTLLLGGSSYPVVTHDIYVLGMVCTSAINFVLAAFAPRLFPLYRKTWIVIISAGGACLGALLILAGVMLGFPGLTSTIGVLLVMTATGVSMLLWCEFFASLNPTRVAIIYAAALVFGELLAYFMEGLTIDFLWPLMIALPILNFIWAVDANTRMESGRPEHTVGESMGVSYPVKLVILMAAVSLTESLLSISSQGSALDNLIGTASVPLVILIVALLEPTRLRVDDVYRIGMPLIIIAMFLIMPSNATDSSLPVILFCGGDISLAIITMVVFSSISYRYGLDAVRLNGIERGIRYGAYVVGWLLQTLLVPLLDTGQVMTMRIVIVAAMIILFGALFATNGGPLSTWGTHAVISDTGHVDTQALRVSACDALAHDNKLTAREQEILLLLSERMTTLEIEQALVIAQGTLKAHISHIYAKTGVHTRSELYDLIEQKKSAIADKAL